MKSTEDSFNRRIRTSLYQDQKFSLPELELLHTPSLQRLYDLRQLGLADRVFIDASHTRLAHVIGVMEVAGRMLRSVSNNLRKAARRRGVLKWTRLQYHQGEIRCDELANLVSNRIHAIRLMALLHDLTHAPYGHTLEDEIELVYPPHDAPIRQSEAFLKLLYELICWTFIESSLDQDLKPETHELPIEDILSGSTTPTVESDDKLVDLAIKAIELLPKASTKRLTADSFVELLIAYNFATRALYYLELSHKTSAQGDAIPEKEYRANKIIELILGKSDNEIAKHWIADDQAQANAEMEHPERFIPRRDAYCLDIIGDTICADLLDYAQRDSVQSGLPLAFDLNRIIENFTIISYVEDEIKDEAHPFCQKCLRAAVDFSSGKFRGDAIGELIELLQVRYYVYERMLFHPTKCVAGGMLGSAIQLAGFKQLPSAWQLVGDAVFMQSLKDVTVMAHDALVAQIEDAKKPAPYTPDTQKSILDRIPRTSLGIAKHARELLLQRFLTIKDLKAAYSGSRPALLWVARLKHAEYSSKQQDLKVLNILSRILTDERSKTNYPDGAHLTHEIIKKLAQDIQVKAKEELTPLSPAEIGITLEALVPTLTSVVTELQASQRLLSRLSARRYAKRIFCLMPANIKAKNIPLDGSVIAERFLKSNIRFAAERAIEQLAKLPIGSAVIHCPPAHGPRKIARVLITYIPPDLNSSITSLESNVEERRETVQLKKIGGIKGPAGSLFKAHHNHIESLENMYASMWRLWVAVCPPRDIDHTQIADAISKVIAAVVFDGSAYVPITNDVFMVQELQDGKDEEASEQEEVITPTIVAQSDRAIGREELKELLYPYLTIFTRKQRSIIEKRLLAPENVTRLSGVNGDQLKSSALRKFSLPYAFSEPEWDARDGQAFIEQVSELIGGNWRKYTLPREVAYRVLSTGEKATIDSLTKAISTERVAQIPAADAPVRISVILRNVGIQVHFQPLLCMGLFGIVGAKPTIVVNSLGHPVASLRKNFDDGEMVSLLPDEIRVTLAHELAHYFLHISGRKGLSIGSNQERITDITEAFCEDEARRILLNESICRSVLLDTPVTSGKISRKAKACGVPPHLLVEALSSSESMELNNKGLGIYLAKQTQPKVLKYLAGDSNRALASVTATLRNLHPNMTLPFEDICNDLTEASAELDISSAVDGIPDRIKLRVSMSALKQEGASYRIIVLHRA